MGKKLCNTLLQFFYREKQDRILVAKSSSFLWRAVPEINSNFFKKKIFFDAASSCFYRHETYFCATSTFFCWHEILFGATSTRFCQNQITFSAMSNFLFQHKIIFRATPNFWYWHHFCYVLLIYFFCHIARKI